MKKMVFLLVLLLLKGTVFCAQKLEKEFQVASGKRLEVNLKSGGSLNITGWDKELLTVSADVSGRDAEEIKLEFSETAAGVAIESHYQRNGGNHSGSARLEIRVPRKFDLKLKTMGGEIRIAGVEGRINGTTMGGALELRDLKGDIHLTTMGGEISLRDSDLDGSLRTMGGRVLFENVKGDVKGTSMGGQVILNNVQRRSGEATGSEVHIRTMGGAIHVNEAPAGADVETMGGEIRIRSAQKFVRAKTMGGNITIEAVDGQVKATTMGGDIQVAMTGDAEKGSRDVTLTSLGGRVELALPADLSMEVDIESGLYRKQPPGLPDRQRFPLGPAKDRPVG